MPTHKTQEPSSWKVVRYANIGVGEPFVNQIMLEIPEIVGVGTIMEPQRTRVKEAIVAIGLEGLMPALNHLRKIRSLPPNLPEMDRRQVYGDFARAVWCAYKELMQIAVHGMGFDIGFLFQPEVKFEKGLQAFQSSYPQLPSSFAAYLRKQRECWQSDLERWRNRYLEHPSIRWEEVRSMYEPLKAESIFESAWKAIADILAVLLQSKLRPGWALQEVPEAERNPNFPNRFRFVRLPPPFP